MRRFLFVLWFFSIAAAAQSQATLWKARGLEAQERIGELTKQAKGAHANGDTQAAKKALWEALIEEAFARHAAVASVAHKKTNAGDAFHLLVEAPSGDKAFLDVVYLYEPNGQPSGVRVDRLPPHWHVLFTSTGMQAGVLVIDPGADGVMLMFSVTEPFEPLVVVNDSPKPPAMTSQTSGE